MLKCKKENDCSLFQERKNMDNQFNKRRVVITGIGMMTPCGKNPDEFWDSMINGKSGIGEISLFETSKHACKIAGEIKDFNIEDYMTKKEARRLDRFTQFAVVSALQAFEDSKLSSYQYDSDRFGVVIGTGTGGIETIEETITEIINKGPSRCSPFTVPRMISNMAAGKISILLNAKGPSMAIVTACSTGSDSIGNAYRMTQYNESDIVVAGGAEASITGMSVAAFTAARAMSCNNDNPKQASRPFETKRDGFVMSEGASILILEELEHALKRDAKIYGEIVGYGRSSDAYDMVSPNPEGEGAAKAMQLALKDASITPEKINYINAHATSTHVGDIAESKAIKKVFGESVTNGSILVNSTKSMTGHMLGAAGSTEAIISILALKNQIIPPTINVENQDPECNFDVVANKARNVSGFEYALSNSFGFGGHNASLIFKKYEA